MAPKRARASTSAQPSPPQDPNTAPVVFNNPAFTARYNELKGASVPATEYPDVAAMNAMGITDDIRWLFQQIGWERLLELNFPTNKNRTLEVVSSFNYYPAEGRRQPRISFQYNGTPYSMNLSEFAGYLGFPCRGEGGKGFPESFLLTDANAFWERISGEPEFHPGKSTITSVFNASLRYAHRILSSTIFARGDSKARVEWAELYMLYRMVNGPRQVNAAYYIAEKLDSFQIKASRIKAIPIGGLVTALAVGMGIDLDLASPTMAIGHINLNRCAQMDLIRTIPPYSQPLLLWQSKLWFPLPHPLALARDQHTWFPADIVPLSDLPKGRTRGFRLPDPNAPRAEDVPPPHADQESVLPLVELDPTQAHYHAGPSSSHHGGEGEYGGGFDAGFGQKERGGGYERPPRDESFGGGYGPEPYYFSEFRRKYDEDMRRYEEDRRRDREERQHMMTRIDSIDAQVSDMHRMMQQFFEMNFPQRQPPPQ